MMTFDNEEELLKISKYHPTSKLLLRIAVDDSKSLLKLSTKFGAKLQTVGVLLLRAQELHLNIIGVSFHVGCLCTDNTAYKKAIADARHVFDQANLSGFQMKILNIGGGFYGDEEFQMVSKGINEALDEFFPADCGVRIIAEPGRYFVESAFTLAMNVFAKRQVQGDPMISSKDGNGLNKLMMYYVTDGVYGSFADNRFYLEIRPYDLRPHRVKGYTVLFYMKCLSLKCN
ncbi:ornithine decarboxylase-like [Boleophthalmus pectinirostris]|uniref:ornithine decarboxylase-like n=1 Tax=Boleophthalmus pectinirostris TaxID=150288 RepID=UPI00242C615B|nr:ornithine decarboxylase-like [Boleophthalmus pectinirostris]